MAKSAVATPEFTLGWLKALFGAHGEHEIDPNSWEAVRRQPGGLYTVVASVIDEEQPASLLDVCCGDGAFLQVAAACPSVQQIIAMDLNPDLLKLCEIRMRKQLARRTSVRFSTHRGNAGKKWGDAGITGIKDTKWDAVTCSSAAMFLDGEQIDNLLHSVRRVKRSDGVFLFSFLSWHQGVGTFRRQNGHNKLVQGNAPIDADPQPFAYIRTGDEHDSWTEYFRPRSWWTRKVESMGFRVRHYHELTIPDDVTDLRQDKLHAGANTYDVLVLE